MMMMMMMMMIDGDGDGGDDDDDDGGKGSAKGKEERTSILIHSLTPDHPPLAAIIYWYMLDCIQYFLQYHICRLEHI